MRELAGAQIPDEPRVYLWWLDGQAIYVGMATSLRGRAWSKHLARCSAQERCLIWLP